MNIDEGAEEKLKIKLVNHLTGEITDVAVDGAEQAKNLYIELASSESVIKRAKDSLRSYLDRFLGDDEQYSFADGKLLRRVQREQRLYRLETLRKFLDEDQLEVCLKVDNRIADALLDELIERGDVPPNAKKVLRDEAEVKATKPYVEIR